MLKKTTVLLLIVLMVFGMGSQLVGAKKQDYEIKTSLVLPEKTDRGGGTVKSQPNGSVQPYFPGFKPKMEKEVMTVKNDKGQIFRTDNEKIPEKYREAIKWFNKNNPPNNEYSDGLGKVIEKNITLSVDKSGSLFKTMSGVADRMKKAEDKLKEDQPLVPVKNMGSVAHSISKNLYSSRDEFKIVKRNEKAYVFFPDKYFFETSRGRKMYSVQESYPKKLAVEKVSEGVYSISGGFVREGQTLSAIFQFTDQLTTVSTVDGSGGRIVYKYIINVTFENENNEDNPIEEPVKSGGLSLNEKNINYKNNEVEAIYELYKPIAPDLRDKPVEFNGVTYEFKTPRYLLYDKNKNEVYDSFSGKVFPQALIDYEADLGNKSINISKEKIKSNNAHYVKIKQYDLETGFMEIDQNKLNNSISWFGSSGFKETNQEQKIKEKASVISRIANKVRGLFK